MSRFRICIGLALLWASLGCALTVLICGSEKAIPEAVLILFGCSIIVWLLLLRLMKEKDGFNRDI